MVRNIGRAILGNENTTKLIQWLKNSPTKYPTLNKQQEQLLIEKYKDNPDKLKEQLVLHNMKIVFNLAKKYAAKTDDFDGMVLDGMLGLCAAASKFDTTLGIKFITYAHIWVEKYILSRFYTKNIDIDRNTTSLNSLTAMAKDGDKVEFEDYVNEYVDPTCCTIKDINDEISSDEQSSLCESLKKHIESDNSISATDRNVFIDMFYNREKTADIADKYDLTREEILGIKHKVLSKLRNVLACDFGISDYAEIG